MFLDSVKTINAILDNEQLKADARRAAKDNDLAGLAGIVNVANGWPISSSVKLGFLFDIAEHFREASTEVAGRYQRSHHLGDVGYR